MIQKISPEARNEAIADIRECLLRAMCGRSGGGPEFAIKHLGQARAQALEDFAARVVDRAARELDGWIKK